MIGRPLAHEGAGVVYGQRKIERSGLQLHPSGFDLGQIEDLVDEG